MSKQPDKLTTEECERIIANHNSGVQLASVALYQQLLDTMRENERLQKFRVQSAKLICENGNLRAGLDRIIYCRIKDGDVMVDIAHNTLRDNPSKDMVSDITVSVVSNLGFGDPYTSEPPVQPRGVPAKQSLIDHLDEKLATLKTTVMTPEEISYNYTKTRDNESE